MSLHLANPGGKHAAIFWQAASRLGKKASNAAEDEVAARPSQNCVAGVGFLVSTSLWQDDEDLTRGMQGLVAGAASKVLHKSAAESTDASEICRGCGARLTP